MRKAVLAILGIGAVAACVFFATPNAWFKLTHRGTPSETQLREAFPGNSQRIIEEAPQLTLLSLDPGEFGQEKVQGKGTFHGYRIVGQAQVDGREKSKLVRALYHGMADDRAFRAACFSPRHGIRVTQAGKNVDLVICFACTAFVSYAEGKTGSARISKDAKTHFDTMLTNAGVPLSPR